MWTIEPTTFGFLLHGPALAKINRIAKSTLGHDRDGVDDRHHPCTEQLQDAVAASMPARSRLGRRVSEAHDGRFPGALRARAASRGRTMALRSDGASMDGISHRDRGDATPQGHTNRVVGDQPALVAFVRLSGD
jgi:hypothetical protein